MSSFSLLHWIIAGAIIFGLIAMARGGTSGERMYCRACGARGTAVTVTRGHLAIEIILWLCFLVPGLLYSVWRLTTRHAACRNCGSDQIIPATAPAAIEQSDGGESKACPFCAETIKKAAVVCKHCGRDLPATI